MVTIPDWRELSLCRDNSVDFFDHRTQAKRQALDALCESCPTSEQCLDFALFPLQEMGIWAGTDPDERREMRASDAKVKRQAETYKAAGIRQPDTKRRVVRKQTV